MQSIVLVVQFPTCVLNLMHTRPQQLQIFNYFKIILSLHKLYYINKRTSTMPYTIIPWRIAAISSSCCGWPDLKSSCHQTQKELSLHRRPSCSVVGVASRRHSTPSLTYPSCHYTPPTVGHPSRRTHGPPPLQGTSQDPRGLLALTRTCESSHPSATHIWSCPQTRWTPMSPRMRDTTRRACDPSKPLHARSPSHVPKN